MSLRLNAFLALTVLALGGVALGCGDKDDDTGGDDSSSAETCDCTTGTLTAVSGCENFGGDEEECSGWHSCEQENGMAEDTLHASGTELTCFGCTIQLTCD